MALLERDTHLAELAAVLRDSATGQGSVVLVTGEAGAGKTALVSEFAATRHGAARVLWGLCDELVTPRPLGPFRDMFPWLAADAARPGPASDLLGLLVDELGKPPHPVIAVVEDAQWADEATLDAIRFIGRRIARIPAVLVVTYRADEVPADHALRAALGAVPATTVRRIRLPPLSIDAVTRLAGRDDVAELYKLTGGNPFFVHEVLAAPDAPVPPTVQDAVMARVGRLSEPARKSAELAAAVPGPVAPWLLAECGAAAGADEAVRSGVLRRSGEAITFTHELARRAVRNSVPTAHWQEINGRILDVLVAHDADPARLTHHAVHAGRDEAVARYAPVAGQAGRLARQPRRGLRALPASARARRPVRAGRAARTRGVLRPGGYVPGSVGRGSPGRHPRDRVLPAVGGPDRTRPEPVSALRGRVVAWPGRRGGAGPRRGDRTPRGATGRGVPGRGLQPAGQVRHARPPAGRRRRLG